MRVAFLDDSEQANPPRFGLGHLLAFAAAIFPQEGLTPFARDLSDIAAELGIPPGEEIKWHPPKGSFLKGAPRATRKDIASADARSRPRSPGSYGHRDH